MPDMDVKFVPRGDGWRARGRPPRQVPAQLAKLLRQTYDNGNQAEIPRAGASDREVAEVLRVLNRGALNMGKKLRAQADDTTIRFYVEDVPDEQ